MAAGEWLRGAGGACAGLPGAVASTLPASPAHGRPAGERSARRIVRAGELLQAFAEEELVPVLAIEGAALEEPEVHGRRQAVLHRPGDDAEVGADEAPQGLAEKPFPLAVAELEVVREARRELHQTMIEERVPHLQRVAHAEPIRHHEQRLEEHRRLDDAQVLRKAAVGPPSGGEEIEEERHAGESLAA